MYTVLEDEKNTSSELQLHAFTTGFNRALYKWKVKAYIRAIENRVAIAKLRHTRYLTPKPVNPFVALSC